MIVQKEERLKAVSNESGILPAETKDGMKIMSISVPFGGWYRCGNFPAGTGWDDCGQGCENGRDVILDYIH